MDRNGEKTKQTSPDVFDDTCCAIQRIQFCSKDMLHQQQSVILVELTMK